MDKDPLSPALRTRCILIVLIHWLETADERDDTTTTVECATAIARQALGSHDATIKALDAPKAVS